MSLMSRIPRNAAHLISPRIIWQRSFVHSPCLSHSAKSIDENSAPARSTRRKSTKKEIVTFDLNELPSYGTPLPPEIEPLRRRKRENITIKSDDADLGETATPTNRGKKASQSDDTAPESDGNVSEAKMKPKRGGKKAVDSGNTDSEEAAFAKATLEGAVPDTQLARVIYKNMQRFPDAILLTRVGSFYETYFSPAPAIAEMLGLKLAYKISSAGTRHPFAGFPAAHIEKHLKVLVQELGHTVVIVEEFHEKDKAGQIPRRVSRIITPGTMVSEGWLSAGENRYLLSIALSVEEEGAKRDVTSGEAEDKSRKLSLAYTDPSTGEFFSKESTLSQIEDDLARISPKEVVLDHTLQSSWRSLNDNTSKLSQQGSIPDLLALLQVLGVHVSFANPLQAPDIEGISQPLLSRPTNTSSEQTAITLLRHHLLYALRENTPSLPPEPDRQSTSSQMQIDAATLAALEIRHAIRPGGLNPSGESHRSHTSSPLSLRGTLLSVLNRTQSSSGHRLLVRTLMAPSTDIEFINKRLQLVQAVKDLGALREELRGMLKGLGDVMRIIMRFRGKRGDLRDVWETGRWVKNVDRIRQRIKDEITHEVKRQRLGKKKLPEGLKRLTEYIEGFESPGSIVENIEEAINEEAMMSGLTTLPGLQASVEDQEQAEMIEGLVAEEEAEVSRARKESGVVMTRDEKREDVEARRIAKEDAAWVISPGLNKDLKRLHDARNNQKELKYAMQAEMRERYGIPNLLLTKTPRCGHCVTVTRQIDYNTLCKTGDFEGLIKDRILAYNPWTSLGARWQVTVDKLFAEQFEAFKMLRMAIDEQSDIIQRNAKLVDELDLACSFAQTAVELGYTRPEVHEGTTLEITAGRHPAVESSLLTSARSFTPNSTKLRPPSSHLHIITGPNQGGKSTLLRQTAVIAILAQSGSFVPAERARVGIVDRVFSRVGARDDLFRDRSTFMLEMVETAAILRHATDRSLVIMDEIGRGTTLHAGVSIAYATLDHLLKHIKCRTLFATHYHELADMLKTPDGKEREGVEFWCTDVDEVDGAFSYSYKIKPGVNNNSHAIRAARLAGMPESFLNTAEITLADLQSKQRTRTEK